MPEQRPRDHFGTGAIWLIASITVLQTLFCLTEPVIAAAPGAPVIGPASPGNKQATVTFSPPASDGGKAISGYTVISNPAGGIDTNAGSTSLVHTVTGLANATIYTFTVTATNADGTSPPSAPSYNTTPRLYAPTTGSINNLVVFIRFSDQPEFSQPLSYYDGLFNTAANSLKNFYLENSYNTLTVSSTFYPTPIAGAVVSYQDPNPTSYYQPYNATTNPGGYLGAQGAARETALVTNALTAISAQIPGGLNLDSDNDGYIDHITFEVYSTATKPLPVMFYSRATYDTSGGIVLNGKKVGSYAWVTASQDVPNSGYNLASTEIHEMGHNFGYPDLRANSGRMPVGDWDVMSTSRPVHSGAYMKYRFTKWIPSIPEITANGTYTLNNIILPTNNSYLMKIPNSNELLVLEYRKASGTFESNLFGSGLCITRINEAAGFWGNLGGPPFFIYYYRANGTLLNDGTGNAWSACFSLEKGLTQFNDNSSPACFLSDGKPCGISIDSIGSSAGSSITFNVSNPVITHTISGQLSSGGAALSGATVTLSGSSAAVSTSDGAGKYLFTVNDAGNYTVTPSKANMTFTPLSSTVSAVTGDQVLNFTAVKITNTITGTVTSGGTPLSGVMVAIACPAGGNYAGSVTTDTTGTYSFFVDAGSTCDISPSKTNYNFLPASKTFSAITTNQVQDFVSNSTVITISGTVTANGSPLSGVSVSCPGANSTTPLTTGATGTYSFSVTVGNGAAYTVTPSSSSYIFSPPFKSFTQLANSQTGQNFAATLKGASTTALGSSLNPSIAEQIVTFTTTVTGSAPTGSVTFNDGATILCDTVPLLNGQAQCTTSALAVGSHTITVTYAGDGSNLGSSSTALTQTVKLPKPTIAILGTIPIGTVDSNYGFIITTTNATSLSLASGTLPPGLSIVTTVDPVTGFIGLYGAEISGTPTAANTYGNLVITASNSDWSVPLSQPFSITVKFPPPTIAGFPATLAMTGIPYSTFTPAACIPPSPSTCNATSFALSGTLPPGLVFSTTNGVIRGTPTTAGIYGNLVISAINKDGSALLPAFSIKVSPRIDSFAAGSPLGTARQGHTATPLPNGKVLVAGGAATASAELYDLATGSWSAAGTMTEARSNHSATLLQNGRVLIVGGFGLSGTLASAELYDPASNSWTAEAAMPNPHAIHTATLLADGSVLVAGGIDADIGILTAVDIYTPSKKSWKTVSPMNVRSGFTATLLPNGKVLFTGGSSLPSAELYDPATDVWSPAGTMKVSRNGHTATALTNGKVLVAGGLDLANNFDIASTEIYDPVANNWNPAASMAIARQMHSASLLSNGSVLVSGGSFNNSGFLTFAELFDPITSLWSVAGSMATARTGHTSTLLSGGNVLMAGGMDGVTTLSSTELYIYGYTVKFQSGVNGNLSGNTSQTVPVGGSTTQISALPAAGYYFVNWTGTGGFVATTANPLTVTGVTAAMTITANFALYSAPVNGACGGSNGGVYSTLPLTNLCAAGPASPVNGSGPWNWSCAGTSGGSAATCSAAADLNAPILTLSTLADHAVTTRTTLNISGTVSDSASGVRSITINSRAVPVIDGSFSFVLQLVDGPNSITTTAIDNAGNATTDIRTIILDTGAPFLIIDQPADNSVTGTTSIEISGSVNDPAATVTVGVNGGSATTAIMSGTHFSATLNLTTGQNTLDITATNQSGKNSSAKRTIISDTLAPTLAITSPAQDVVTTQGTVLLSGMVADPLSNPVVNVTVDNQSFIPVVAADGSFSQTISLPTGKIYVVTVTATDQAGNRTTVQRNIIRNVVATTTAKVYLGIDDTFNVNSSGITVYGGAGNNAVVVADGVSGVTLDQNVQLIYLSAASDSYSFKQSGNKIAIHDLSGATQLVSVPIQSGVTRISFSDGAASAVLTAGRMTLGSVSVSSESPMTLTPSLTAAAPQPATTTAAKTYLGIDDNFTIGSSGTTVFGGPGIDAVTIASGVSAVTLDQNVERINLSGTFSSYTFKQTGNKINIYDATGSTLIVTVPVQGDTDGTVLGFSNGSASALLSSGVMTLGGATVSKSTPGTVTPTLQ